MTILSYSRTRLQLAALFFVLAALLLYLRVALVSGFQGGEAMNPIAAARVNALLFVFLLFAAAPLARILYLLSGDMVAIRALPDSLQVTGFFGRRLVPWGGIVVCHAVDYGNILHRNRWLNLRYEQNGASRTVRVPLILSKRESGGHAALPQKIERAREQAMGRSFAPVGSAGPDGDFDPDAAIRRYLQAKANAPDPAPAAPDEPAPPPVRPGPVRPAFGRKGL